MNAEEEGERQAKELMKHFVEENPGAEKYALPYGHSTHLTPPKHSQSHRTLR